MVSSCPANIWENQVNRTPPVTNTSPLSSAVLCLSVSFAAEKVYQAEDRSLMKTEITTKFWPVTRQ